MTNTMAEPATISDRPSSRNGRGIEEIQEVIKILKDAGIMCCIVGGKALLYYGVHRIPTDWHVCVPNDQFSDASAIFTRRCDTYEPGAKILPQIRSLLHTYPRFKQKGVNFSFYIMPAFEYFIHDLDETMIERSKNDVPYPKLEHFAQSLVSTQRWPELAQLIDGMDLDEEWGTAHLHLGMPSQAEREYVEQKNIQYKSVQDQFPNSNLRIGTLSKTPMDRTEKWKALVGAKGSRIGLHLPKERYATQFRRKGSQDPRLRDRAV
ncbi:hypothetical protein GGR54DRAFT_626957 [Hypoxylon sp. NC1633]|nr:hypothetical protein GGR54DRAFT_626957 [Hypoxylon sp. NC1633]